MLPPPGTTGLASATAAGIFFSIIVVVVVSSTILGGLECAAGADDSGAGPKDGARDERRDVRPLAAEEGARVGTGPREGARLPARDAGLEDAPFGCADGPREARRGAVLRGLIDGPRETARPVVGMGGRSASWSSVSSPMLLKEASGSSLISSEMGGLDTGNSMLGATGGASIVNQ